MDKTDIADRISLLLQKTVENGCTPEEAASAASKAQELLDKYNLSMFDIKQKKIASPVADEEFQSYYCKLPGWCKHLISCFSMAFDCKPVIDQSGDHAIIHFIGLEADALTAKHFYTTMADRLWKLAKQYAKVRGVSRRNLARYTDAFIVSAGSIIRDRLIAQKNRKKSESQTYGELLVVKDDVINEFVSDKFPDIKQVRYSTKNSSLGQQDGLQVGSTIPLNQELEHQQRIA